LSAERVRRPGDYETTTRRMYGALVLCLLLWLAATGSAFGAGITNSGDDLRTGWYPNESSISPQLVSGGTFGQLWSTPVSGQVYAQPLLANGALLVATENNELYSLDPATGMQNWSTLLGTPWNASDIGCEDLAPTIGVTGTPVIDSTTNTTYLTHKTYVSGHAGAARWYMDAINMATGAEKPGFPVELSGAAQNAPAQTFQPTAELQRPGLLLMNGVVYAAFGSDCDHPVWQGWVFGVSTGGVTKARWVADATGEGAGIWQSGAGLTSDGTGNILLSTGNGGAPTTPTPGKTPPPNLGESIVRLQVQGDGSLKATDFFAPFDASSLDGWDADFASGGVTGLPAESFGTATIPHLAVAVGKDGYVYLLNRDNLGGIAQGPSGSDNVVQRLGPYGGVWSRPGVWPGDGGWVYIPTASGGNSPSGSAGNLRVYRYGLSGTGSPALSLQATSSEEFGFGTGAPVITSDGTTSGTALVWTIWMPNGGGVGAQLRAYDPVPVSGQPVLRWRAPIGTGSKFSTPGVGAGRVYVGTRDGHVLGFGSPVTPALGGSATEFPATTVGNSIERKLTLTANETLTLASLSSSSAQFKLGTPSPPLHSTLTTGQTVEVPITFTPTTTGPLGATVTATTGSGKTATFAASGSGQAPTALLEVTPPLVTFGGTTVGGELSGSATFRNVGGSSLSIEEVELPSPPFGAEGVPAVPSTIAPGHSITITVTFKPTEIGTFGDEIGLDTSGGNEAVGLSGTAAPPGVMQISSEANDFGDVPIGATATKTFTVTNAGGTAVTLTKSKPPDGGAFAALTSLAEGTTIQPGASVTETVSFAPMQAGQASGVWLINGNDAHPRVHEVQFTGVGVVPAPPEVTGFTPPSTPPALATPIGVVGPVKVTGPPLILATLRGKVSRSGQRAHRVLLTYTLSAAAEVKATIYRRIIAHGCRHGAAACVRWEATRLKRTVAGHAGSNKLAIDLGALPIGEYRVNALPFPPSGTAGATQYLRFKIS
jgi:Abnormal spindle-like microcephaly-assoc'd, ASPM-SPD-2-Hydin/PQQ-like domain